MPERGLGHKKTVRETGEDVLTLISRFFGIVIKMFHSDHPRPHFRVEYAECRATFAIDPLGLLAGKLPTRQHLQVVEWALAHQPELLADWRMTRAHQPPRRIAPLE